MYNKTGLSVIGLFEVPKNDVNKYGIVKLVNDEIVDMVEKPSIESAPSNLAIIGRYVITPRIFDLISETKTRLWRRNSTHRCTFETIKI